MIKQIVLGLLILGSCTSRDTYVDKKTLMAYDYRLFQGTSIWELAKATQDDKFDEMEELVKEKKLEVNQKDPKFGQTLVFLTIWHKQVDACSKLLSLGADPNIHEVSDNKTALIMAANEQDLKVSIKLMQLLLKYKADVNLAQQDRSEIGNDTNYLPLSRTPLMTACGSLNKGLSPLPKVELLVKAGAEINYVGNNNATALREALFLGNYDIALYLLEHGANYNLMFTETSKYDENKPTYILDFLRSQLEDFGTTRYEYKMKIVSFLKTKGVDYWQHPIPSPILEEIKRDHPDSWEEYLKKY